MAMPDNGVEKRRVSEPKLGYRARRPEEREGPDDRRLIALDPEVQPDFERIIFALFEEGEARRRGK